MEFCIHYATADDAHHEKILLYRGSYGSERVDTYASREVAKRRASELLHSHADDVVMVRIVEIVK